MVINNRRQLAEYFNILGYRRGAEVGVSQGNNALNFCKAIPKLKLYLIDIWDNMNHMFEAQKKMQGYNVEFVKGSSMNALRHFKDNSLDFVFIDGDHTFDYVMEDIIGWSRKVRRGGAIAGHDYYHFTNSGVIEAVNAYCEAHRIDLMLTGVDPDSPDDKKPSFYWIKK